MTADLHVTIDGEIFRLAPEVRNIVETLIRERDEALARNAEAWAFAGKLAVALHETHFKNNAPDWKPLPDLVGIITQIDNMTCGIEAEARAKALEEAAAVAKDFGLPAVEGLDWALAYRQQNIAVAILALRKKP